MKYSKFEVENFKGIQKISLDLNSTPKSPVFILVGLNESGKTTILEALSYFYENLKEGKEQSIQPGVVNNIHDLIPKNKKDNFNDEIRIKCSFELEQNDINEIEKAFKELGYIVDEFSNQVTITQSYKFINSTFKSRVNIWEMSFQIRKKQGKAKAKKLDINHEAFQSFSKTIYNLLPPILYYPNFLFNFPDKIYLEVQQNESKEQVFYRRVLQDILDSLENNLNLQTHVIDRAKSDKSQDRDALESVLNKMGDKMTKVIFNNNFSIFRSDTKNKAIIVTVPKLDPNTGSYFVELKLKDGQDSYYIRERSLGFRWFFIFLLFTQFRLYRSSSNKNLIFLFDEPASNLHQSAQQRLLKALEDLTNQSLATIIYATHSHHLINPLWLESTFVVINQALNYDNDETYSSSMTNIYVEKYRSFVGRYPDQRNYYQPILDILEYKPSNLENIPDVVIVEGKNDFYTLEYFQKVILERKSFIPLMPGGGSSSLDNLISLYYAWGRNFLILLDSDSEGNIQKQRYLDKFGKIVEGYIFSLEDIEHSFKDKGMEKIMKYEDRMIIQKSTFSNLEEYSKKQFNLSLQENLVLRKKVQVSSETKQIFIKIFDFLEQKLNEQKNQATLQVAVTKE